MTTIEERPSSPVAVDVAPARDGVPPRPRHRGALRRRLPYALAVLALAAGYAVGHSTDNPAPPVAAAVSARRNAFASCTAAA